MPELKIGDIVKILKYDSKHYGLVGTIRSIPQPGLAWVQLEWGNNGEEYCYKFENLLNMITREEKVGQEEQMNGQANVMNQQGSIKKDETLEKNRVRGAGGAPTRATTLPDDPASRKEYPIASGVLDYFPDAIVAISKISKAGNDQHNPGLPLRWTRSKSGDESDTCIRHFLQRGTLDTDGQRHTAKAAWRMLAILQKEIEAEQDE